MKKKILFGVLFLFSICLWIVGCNKTGEAVYLPTVYDSCKDTDAGTGVPSAYASGIVSVTLNGKTSQFRDECNSPFSLTEYSCFAEPTGKMRVGIDNITCDGCSNGACIDDTDLPPIQGPPSIGQCGSILNSCTGGILSDIPDTPAQYLWICLGQRGGSNASCSLLRPTNQTNDLDAKGYHDSSSCNYITGWACDPDSYVAQLQILFYADGPRHVSSGWSSSSNRQGIFIGSTIANTSREVAVGSQCGGYTAHGFRFVTPQIVKDSLTHPIYAYAVGIRSNGSTGFYRLLTGSPKSLTNCTINNNTLTVR